MYRNHKIVSNKGCIEARYLKIGYLITSNYENNRIIKTVAPCLNDDQLQLVYGSYLGKGYLYSTPSNRLRLKNHA